MKVMSSKEIKNRYGAFVEAARREPVVHTSHGRPTLVTLSVAEAKQIPHLREQLEALGAPSSRNPLLDLIGKGRHLSAYKSDDEIMEAMRAERDAWP